MTVEIIGILPHRYYSEVYAHPLSEFDNELLEQSALAHERAGFDRVLIANSATYPDSLPVGTWVAARTTKLKLMLAHRPGFVAPTMAARMFAALDRLSHGRAGVHIITGSNDVEMQADGDFLTKERRYARSREYVQILKKLWASDTPQDFDGEFYRFNGGFAAVKPGAPDSVPVFWGGGSDPAIAAGAEVADIFALNIGPRPMLEGAIERVREQASGHGRDIEFLLSSRIVLGETDDAAWALAHEHLHHLVRELDSKQGLEYRAGETAESARQRAFEAAAENRDGPLFSAFREVGVGRPLSNCLVGTVDTVVAQLLGYYRLGVTRFILAGYDPRAYPEEFGGSLLPRLRAAIAAEGGPR